MYVASFLCCFIVVMLWFTAANKRCVYAVQYRGLINRPGSRVGTRVSHEN